MVTKVDWEDIFTVLRRMRDRSETPEFQAGVQKIEAEAAEKLEIREGFERQHYLSSSGIPRMCWDRLDAPGESESMTAVRRFLDRPVRVSPDKTPCVFLTLAGPSGRRKTSAAGWACFQLRGMFLDARELVHAGQFDPIWDDIHRTQFLVIDELGAEHTNDAAQSSLMSALIKREGNLRKTIIITNLDAPGFKARYMSGPMQRLGERLEASGEWVSLPGPSLRTHWSEATP
jgi:hypothetical protein